MICPKCFQFEMLTGGCSKCDKVGSINFNKNMDNMFGISTKKIYTELVSDQESQPLTLEKLTEALNKCKREDKHIYILEQRYLPDDCYGILILRPEDAKQWPRKNK